MTDPKFCFRMQFSADAEGVLMMVAEDLLPGTGASQDAPRMN